MRRSDIFPKPPIRQNLFDIVLTTALLCLPSSAYAAVFNIASGGQIFDFSTSVFTFSVSGEGTITDLNVRFSAQHTYDSDLTVFLRSPTGTQIQLFSQVGSFEDNFQDTLLDDQAAIAITAGDAPFIGAYRPSSPLSAFNGQNPNGTWTLSIVDDFAAEDGYLYQAGDAAPWGTALGTQLSFNSSTPVPYEFSPTLGILVLGGWGAATQLKKQLQKRK